MREPARRVFAAEYNRSEMKVKEGESQYAPGYVITPTGARCNRLFVVGVLTEVEDIGREDSLYRARVSDPTGTFLVYAGRYQPEAAQVLSSMEPPEFVAVTGKADVYQPDDGDTIPSIRPEAVSTVDRGERDRWVVTTARRTIERLEKLDQLPEEVEERYHPSLNEYRDVVREALRNLLGEERHEPSVEDEPEDGEADPETGRADGEQGRWREEPPVEDVEEWDFS
ncbi:MAG: hypothetical protein MAG715_00017 [Methanonatronarchaeales archaeon]|nr:hypothetical protein [Methanonatronarchaeales archaeon]